MSKTLFLTSYTRNGHMFGSHIFADSQEQAESLCIKGETVVGESTSDNGDCDYGFPLVEYFLNIDDADAEYKASAYLEFLAYINTYGDIIAERMPEVGVLGAGEWLQNFNIVSTIDDHTNPLYEDARVAFISFLDAVAVSLPERFITTH